MDGHRWDAGGGPLMKFCLILRNQKIIKMVVMMSFVRKAGRWKLKITEQF